MMLLAKCSRTEKGEAPHILALLCVLGLCYIPQDMIVSKSRVIYIKLTKLLHPLFIFFWYNGGGLGENQPKSKQGRR
jgi:hypothetical protein